MTGKEIYSEDGFDDLIRFAFKLAAEKSELSGDKQTILFFKIVANYLLMKANEYESGAKRQ